MGRKGQQCNGIFQGSSKQWFKLCKINVGGDEPVCSHVQCHHQKCFHYSSLMMVTEITDMLKNNDRFTIFDFNFFPRIEYVSWANFFKGTAAPVARCAASFLLTTLSMWVFWSFFNNVFGFFVKDCGTLQKLCVSNSQSFFFFHPIHLIFSSNITYWGLGLKQMTGRGRGTWWARQSWWPSSFSLSLRTLPKCFTSCSSSRPSLLHLLFHQKPHCLSQLYWKSSQCNSPAVYLNIWTFYAQKPDLVLIQRKTKEV